MSSLFPYPGPQLPLFKTLLIKGPYHPSAPIHLCLSHAASQSPFNKAIILTPSRQTIVHALQEYNDDWLSASSGHGNITELSSRINVFYPPSPAHLSLLLSMFRIPQSTDRTSLNPKTTLDMVPSLVVLHELSAYFLPNISSDPDSHSWTVSSYLTLVTRTLASLSSLSKTNDSDDNSAGIAFALFDSQLDQLKLPVLRRPQVYEADEDDPSPRLESVSVFVQKYIEWLGVFEHDPTPTESLQEAAEDDYQNGEQLRRKTMRLYRCGGSSDEEVTSWKWSERLGPLRGASERRGILFQFICLGIN